ncbi:2-succinyl-5-enolpyruvyl-6-hydroxy-3-cyclohexene-1-carboxylic-acid synthase [Ohtaekwangia koreensis]|uniref:2-succinyl-5-enolpyruvyl-6-hydroxy-3-cyclohexene-1-carboxylate synthase n=1 Tax=Ohtaekwangia koreensis TaxID=688867 RepID=A0A1T5M2N8_9BACT|nr:2-succinyl-5-enolpyruvyl-6-hydroxy-3-cyclohexene-1-carboxylic-acid synthase [Ohtaekwangia koreensis]SKC82395.1 2-succinyl-5-enolpyruvyl-6-hydroxy-3-cyclohexene-1-carboxylate synthase [Ohtaekwangia koreensis]
MARFQPIYDIAELCSRKGLTQAILCPGSRCAPLTLAFVRHPDITTRTFSDERSAGFVALGIAQQKKAPAVVVCTSGSAAYNLAPAVAEAWFSETPLIILTADRPAEWIAQHDGQTIHQTEIFGKHVKKFFQLPQEYEHADSQWAINRIVNEAINLSFQEPKGPVHINAPFREPLYPSKEDAITFSTTVRVMDEYTSPFTLSEEQKKKLTSEWRTFHNTLIVAGQHEDDPELNQALSAFFAQHNIPIAGDVISNLHDVEKLVRHADTFLGQASNDVKKTLRPDLLITFGKSIISKNLKLFLRKYTPKVHWHIQPAGVVADTFQSITNVFNASPANFFQFLSSLPNTESFENQKQNNFNKFWEVEERRAVRTLEDFFPQDEFAELELVHTIIQNLPENCNLHLANSMSVRYANSIGLMAHQKGIQVYSNRGTSGIDGCTSTAVGHSLSNDRPNVLITGDLAFFYDRNAFWHNYTLPNLRVVLLNNHGGVIFKMIDGPGSLPEADEYFITRQKLSAKKLCEEFGFDHLKLDNKRKIKNLVKDFFDFDGKTKILELETDTLINKIIFDNLKEKIKKSYEL